MNENRSLFGLNGITGMLIATVLLLSILAYLTVHAMGVQTANAENFYELKNASSIKMIDTHSASHIVTVK